MFAMLNCMRKQLSPARKPSRGQYIHTLGNLYVQFCSWSVPGIEVTDGVGHNATSGIVLHKGIALPIKIKRVEMFAQSTC